MTKPTKIDPVVADTAHHFRVLASALANHQPSPHHPVFVPGTPSQHVPAIILGQAWLGQSQADRPPSATDHLRRRRALLDAIQAGPEAVAAALAAEGPGAALTAGAAFDPTSPNWASRDSAGVTVLEMFLASPVNTPDRDTIGVQLLKTINPDARFRETLARLVMMAETDQLMWLLHAAHTRLPPSPDGGPSGVAKLVACAVAQKADWLYAAAPARALNVFEVLIKEVLNTSPTSLSRVSDSSSISTGLLPLILLERDGDALDRLTSHRLASTVFFSEDVANSAVLSTLPLKSLSFLFQHLADGPAITRKNLAAAARRATWPVLTVADRPFASVILGSDKRKATTLPTLGMAFGPSMVAYDELDGVESVKSGAVQCPGLIDALLLQHPALAPALMADATARPLLLAFWSAHPVTPLRTFAEFESANLVRFVLDNRDALMDWRTKDGSNILHHALLTLDRHDNTRLMIRELARELPDLMFECNTAGHAPVDVLTDPDFVVRLNRTRLNRTAEPAARRRKSGGRAF